MVGATQDVKQPPTESAGIEILPYTKDLEGAARDLNRRLDRLLGETRLRETCVPSWLPKIEGRRIYQEHFLAVEGGTVRGGYTLKHQDMFLGGEIYRVSNTMEPISEGIDNRKYALLGPRLLLDALRRQPRLFGLGMGGYDRPIVRILKGMRWKMRSVPFYFKVLHEYRFLRNIRFLRRSTPAALALDAIAVSGVGWAGFRALNAALALADVGTKRASSEGVDKFSAWADQVWQACKNQYSMIAVRDSETLNILYPPDSKRFIRLKVSRGGRTVGWAVVLDTPMSGHKQFGNMRVGSIVDCLAAPEDAAAVIRAAAGELEKRGVDLIVSNQHHAAWCAGLGKAGFLQGPSNFIFATSQQLSKLLEEIDPNRTGIHLNRGDGEGPIHL